MAGKLIYCDGSCGARGKKAFRSENARKCHEKSCHGKVNIYIIILIYKT